MLCRASAAPRMRGPGRAGTAPAAGPGRRGTEEGTTPVVYRSGLRRPFRPGAPPSWPRRAAHPIVRCYCSRCPEPPGPHRAPLQVSPRGSGARRREFGPPVAERRRAVGTSVAQRTPLPASCSRGGMQTDHGGRKRSPKSHRWSTRTSPHWRSCQRTRRAAVEWCKRRWRACRRSRCNEIALNVSAGVSRDKDELASLV